MMDSLGMPAAWDVLRYAAEALIVIWAVSTLFLVWCVASIFRQAQAVERDDDLLRRVAERRKNR